MTVGNTGLTHRSLKAVWHPCIRMIQTKLQKSMPLELMGHVMLAGFTHRFDAVRHLTDSPLVALNATLAEENFSNG